MNSTVPEYRVPKVLQKVREARATLTLSQSAETYPPSRLYAMCEATTREATALRILYNHAMIEVGFIGEKPEPNFAPYKVCPVCGYVLEGD